MTALHRTATGAENTRSWWAAAAAGAVLFAVYISLVPFTFVRPPAGIDLIPYIASHLEWQVDSSTNFVANAIMFVPWGFFGLAALTDDDAEWRRLVPAALLVVAISLAVSVAVESAQVFVAGRTPSFSDFVGQTLGTLAGLAAWRVLGRELSAWARVFLAGRRSALEVGLAVYAAVRGLLLLESFDVTVELPALAERYRNGLIVLNPLQSPTLRWDLLPSILGDFVLAVPIGVLAAVGGKAEGTRRSAPMAIGLGVLFFAAGEFAQVFIRSRTADIVDFAVSAAGVVAGALVVATLTGRSAGAARPARAGHPVLAGGLVLAVVVHAAYNLSPFDFAPELLSARISRLAGIPFMGYYENPEAKAVADIFIKLSLALPFGLLFHLLARPDRSPYRRSLTVGWLVVMAGYFTVVEVGQVILPSRYPDNTDILLAVAGVWLGMRLAAPFAAATPLPSSSPEPATSPRRRHVRVRVKRVRVR